MDSRFVTIKYKTADGRQICVEVSTAVKELLEQSDRQIRSQRRQDRRHLYQENFAGELTETAVRFLNVMDTADLVMKKEHTEKLYNALDKLTCVQRRRVLLYYMAGVNHREIALMEGVNRASVSRSIEAALKKLHKALLE